MLVGKNLNSCPDSDSDETSTLVNSFRRKSFFTFQRNWTNSFRGHRNLQIWKYKFIVYAYYVYCTIASVYNYIYLRVLRLAPLKNWRRHVIDSSDGHEEMGF